MAAPALDFAWWIAALRVVLVNTIRKILMKCSALEKSAMNSWLAFISREAFTD